MKLANTTSLLADLFHQLKANNYAALQYIPTRRSFFGLFKEGENIVNLFRKRKHLMFYYSINPTFYLKSVIKATPALFFFYRFCFVNEPVEAEVIAGYMGEDWVDRATKADLLQQAGTGKFFLMVGVLPAGEYLIIRDHYNSYQYYEYDSSKPHNRVYVGADSVKFVEYNQRHLGKRRFRNVLELGCGTGIQLICIENFCERLTGIDVNPRAVEFTMMSARLNGLANKFEVFESDLFEKIDRTFDLILANPWFVDLEKGGLEEIPGILERLDHFLEPHGTFAMYFGSYIKDGIDQGKAVLTDFAQRKNYDAVFYRLGKTIEPEFLDRYQALNISHINSYYAILTKSGTGAIRIMQPSVLRRVRDEVYIPLQRKLARPKR